MGCKGPVTFQNCPVVRWNEATNWPIGCGHPCIGCAEPDFWDRMTPFYQHLSGIPGFGLATPIDKVGMIAAAGVGVAFGAHGLIAASRLAAKKHADKKAKGSAPPKDKGAGKPEKAAKPAVPPGRIEPQKGGAE
jgi:hydrogenase small subunit